MDPTICWDCPTQAWALLLYVMVMIVAAWVVGRARGRARIMRVIAEVAIWFGIPVWLIDTVYVPRWGIRIYDSATDASTIYGTQARAVMVVGGVLILANLGVALWPLWRRAREKQTSS